MGTATSRPPATHGGAGIGEDALRADINVKLHAAKQRRRDLRSNRAVLEECLGTSGSVSYQKFHQAAGRIGVQVPDRHLKAVFSRFEHGGCLDCAALLLFVCGADDGRGGDGGDAGTVSAPSAVAEPRAAVGRPRSTRTGAGRGAAAGVRAASGPAGKRGGNAVGAKSAPAAAAKSELLADASEAGVRDAAVRIADVLFERELGLRQAFKQWDTNASGGLDPAEFGAALSGLGFRAAPETVEAVFRAFDLNENGVISCWEFIRGLGNLQARAEEAADAARMQQRRAQKLDAAMRRQGGGQLAITGAGLGGGHAPQVNEARNHLSAALRKTDVETLREAVRKGAKAGLPSDELQAARAQLQELEEKSAAREALEEALDVRPRDAERLRAAVADAEAAGLAEANLDAARRALAEEEWRAAVRRRLGEALQSRDPGALREAIDDGEGASLPEQELEEPRRVLAEEDRKVRSLARLEQALGCDDLEELRRALLECEKAGCAGGLVDTARSQIRDREKQLQEMHDLEMAMAAKSAEEAAAKERACADLRDAVASGNVDHLRSALEEAKRLKVSPSALQDASDQLAALQRQHAARAALKSALAGDEAELLRAALHDAESAGLDDADVEAAREALTKADRRDAARRRLRDALRSRDAEALRIALADAERAGLDAAGGLDAEALAAAARALADEERKERAASGLRQAVASRDVDLLCAALEEARACGLPARDIAAAEALLAAEGQKAAALRGLREASSASDLERLRSALAQAEAVGVNAFELDEAKRLLVQLQRRAAARDRLQHALRTGDIEELRAAIDECERAGLCASELEEARQVLAEEESKVQARQGLKSAVQAMEDSGFDDAQAATALRVALRGAARLGLDEKELEPARAALRRHEERQAMLQRLQAAISSRDISALRAALSDCSGAGFPDAELAKARQVLSDEEAKTSARRRLQDCVDAVTADGNDESLAELRGALTNCERLGIGEAELVSARRALEDAEKKAKARSALRAAVASGDMGQLRAALLQGEAASLGSAELAAAKDGLAKATKRQAARRKLQDALAAEGDVQRLRAAIDAASTAGLDASELDKARAVLRAAEKKAEARSRLKQAETRLSIAVSSADASDEAEAVKELADALRAADGVGLTEMELERATKMLGDAERRANARVALAEAVAGKDVDALRSAIHEGEKAGLGSVDLEVARVMLGEELRRNAARGSLQDALASNVEDADVNAVAERLRSALSEGSAAGLHDDELAEARRALAAVDRRCRATNSLRDAEADLQASVDSDRCSALRAALQEGEAAGVAQSLLTSAKNVLDAAERKLRAAEGLRKAVSVARACDDTGGVNSLQMLRDALEEASRENLPDADLADAEKLLAAQEEKDSAISALRAAVAAQDVSALRAAVLAAEATGLTSSAPDFAQAEREISRLDGLEQARQQLQRALSTAGEDVAALRAALQDASAAGLSSEELRFAEQTLASAESRALAQQKLREAAASGDPRQLLAAVEEGSRLGLDTGELRNARHALGRAEAKASLHRAAAAAREGDVADENAIASELREALDAADAAGLEDAEMDEVRGLLAAAKRRASARQRLGDALRHDGNEDDNDARLRGAMEEGQAAGLPASELAEADRLVREAEERAQLHRTLKCVVASAGAGHGVNSPTLDKTKLAGHLIGANGSSAEREVASSLATTDTRVHEKAEFVWQETELNDDVNDNDIISSLKQRLRKVHTSPAEALAQCMQIPSVAMIESGGDVGAASDALPEVDSEVLRAFAGQLQFSLSRSRAESFLQGFAGQVRSEVELPTISVPAFLEALGCRPSNRGAGVQTGTIGNGGSISEAAAHHTATVASGQVGVAGGNADSRSYEERRVQLQRQRKPSEHLRQLVLQQRVDHLAHSEQQLVTQLREALFERRSSMKKMFKSVDLNDDGIVTLEEFLHALEGAGVAVGHEIDRCKAHVTEEEAARLLAFFDRDGQGVLRYNEFMRLLQGTIEPASASTAASAAFSPSSGPNSPTVAAGAGVVRQVFGVGRGARADDAHRVQSAFLEWDRNGDGVITRGEFQEVMRRCGPEFTSSQVMSMFRAADCNSDGVIDLREFLAWLLH